MKDRVMLFLLFIVGFLPLSMYGVMELSLNPSEVTMGVLPGNTARTYLEVSNTGSEERSFSLFHALNPVSDQQVAYYPFDSLYTDMFTCTSGTIVNLPFVEDRDSEVSSAVYFTGASKYITRDFALQNDFSVSFWAKPVVAQTMYSQSYGNAPLYAKYLIGPEWGGTSNWGGFGIALGTNGIMLIEHGHAYMPCLLSYSANLAGWHHYTVTFSNHAPKLYIDGILVQSGISSQRSYTRLSHELGSYVYGSYSGYLDDFCVFSSSLSPSQVHDVFTYDNKSRFIISPQYGAIAAGASKVVMLKMVETSLSPGIYTDELIFCQGGNVPEYQIIPVEIEVSDRGPLAPASVTINRLPNGDVLLQWQAVTQDTYGDSFSPDCYRIYRAESPGSPDDYVEIGQSSSTQYVDSHNPLLPSQPMRFYLIRAE